MWDVVAGSDRGGFSGGAVGVFVGVGREAGEQGVVVVPAEHAREHAASDGDLFEVLAALTEADQPSAAGVGDLAEGFLHVTVGGQLTEGSQGARAVCPSAARRPASVGMGAVG
ncbi:hypothetical protein LQ327_09800 [Actinomycetospora endophytica]|uniref:Uncharacterized protein n=1 Tax=Actinomycetospora endophytica TaxID=2291215 RepID=A0ABS8P5Z3_9PSEU|nr:hypothetical protein [Actinomycetospora endophytica]MCD2193673.1 hypothetical protein [Actinomycetospora endophytica]